MDILEKAALETAANSGEEAAVTALVATHVARETASLATELETAKADLEAAKAEAATAATEIASLRDQLDLVKTEVASARQELVDYKAALEQASELERICAERASQVAEKVPALEQTDERKARWASMDEAAFNAYLSELSSVATVPATTTFDVAAEKSAVTPPVPVTQSAPTRSAAEKYLGL